MWGNVGSKSKDDGLFRFLSAVVTRRYDVTQSPLLSRKTGGSRPGRETRFFEINTFTGRRCAKRRRPVGVVVRVPKIGTGNFRRKLRDKTRSFWAGGGGRGRPCEKLSSGYPPRRYYCPCGDRKIVVTTRARRPIPLPRRKRASRAVPLCDARTQWRGPRKIIRRPCDPNTYLSSSLLLRHYRRRYRCVWNCYRRVRSSKSPSYSLFTRR